HRSYLRRVGGALLQSARPLIQAVDEGRAVALDLLLEVLCCADELYPQILPAFHKTFSTGARCDKIGSRCDKIGSRCDKIASKCDKIASKCDKIASRCDKIASKCDKIAPAGRGVRRPTRADRYPSEPSPSTGGGPSFVCFP